VLPHLVERWPTTRRVGIGASLGALAWLHAQASYPEVADGLFLQSGSYFRPETDPQESGFSEFPAIVRFVASVHRGPRPTRPTCSGPHSADASLPASVPRPDAVIPE
jgi:hypothetical protein